MLGRVIREIGRFALAKVDQVSNSIQVHRLVQAVIRDSWRRRSSGHRHDVHRILAGARPVTSRSTTRRPGPATATSGRTSARRRPELHRSRTAGC